MIKTIRLNGPSNKFFFVESVDTNISISNELQILFGKY